MEAQAWTAIGLLGATLIWALTHLGSRIERNGARIDALATSLGHRIDSLHHKMDSRASRLHHRIEGLTSEVRALNARFDTIAALAHDHPERPTG